MNASERNEVAAQNALSSVRRYTASDGAQLALIAPPAATELVTEKNQEAGDVIPARSQALTEFISACQKMSSLRGWWRTLQIARVLGTLGFYLFLDNYDARRSFNRRMAARKRE